MATRKHIAAALAGAAVLAGGYFALSGPAAPPAGEALTTGATDTAPRTLGPSGLPLPRFVSLKSEKVNVRRGPSSDYKVAWVFERKGMPVEITAEFENWRRIRDSDGAEGWILQNMLSGKRMAAVAPWKVGNVIPLLGGEGADTGLVARVEAGAIGEISSCGGEWCQVTIAGYEGYMDQTLIWGAYPGEKVDN